MLAGHGKSLRSSAGGAPNGETKAQRWLGLEPLEPRLLLSGSAWEQVLAGVSATAALDSTSRFSWSGYRSGSAQVELSYTFSGRPEMTDGQTGLAVTLDGESDWVSPGDPMVPLRTSRVLLPPGTHIVSAEVSCGPGTVVAAGVGLAAAPTPVPYGSDAPAGPDAPAASFPTGEPVRWSTESLAGYRLGRLELFPVHYTADDGTITSYEQITVTLTLAADEPHDGVAVRDLAADASRVLDLADNDSAIGGYAPAAGGGDGGRDAPLQGAGPYEYVLITSSALSGQFQRLVDHKAARGLSATLVTTEHIYANYTSPFSGEDDNAGKIREFLTQAYTQWNTRWVVLAGDVDQVAHRMVRVSANDETATFASDMYFACLDGPYNANPDGHWAKTDDGSGGGDVDRMPELFVGRATVSTPAEAGLFVDKTIRYESQAHPNVSDCLWLSEKLDDGPVTWGAEVMETIRGESFADEYDHVMLYERDGPYATGDVVAALNASPNFVNHLGHADWTNSAKLHASDVRGLTNEEPYFLYSEGCESGKFERDDAIAEEHIQAAAGAWAVIMNTDFGWYEPGGVGGSYYWHSEFWDAVFNEGITRVGEAHFDSKTDLGSTSGTDRWVFFACQLFGDPETKLQVAAVGGVRVLSHSPSEVTSGPESTVRMVFSDGMDRASFDVSQDVVSFIGPGGTDLSGAITGYTWRDPWTLDVHFTAQSGFGSYELTVGPAILDMDGDPMDQDLDGQAGEAGDDSYAAAFTITAGGGRTVLYSADMSSDPGWTLDSGSGGYQWQWGTPAGNAGDPAGGFTWDHVMGYNLAGAYADGMSAPEYATTPSFDCSEVPCVMLSFRRWLGVEAATWDHATIEVSADGGPWVQVWANGDEVIEDTSWTLQNVDLSAVAGGRSSVRVRWGMGPTDSFQEYCGWNIDDVVITGSQLGAVVYSADLSTDPGWTLDEGSDVPGWQWGVPAGNEGDPTGGFTGDHVIGFNLDGAYSDAMSEARYATTPAFDCTGATGVSLSFRRWLGVEGSEWDQAAIEVSADGGPWVQVWANGSDGVEDTSWTLQQVDISAVADGRSAVRIRWGMGPTDASLAYCGWNIDDVTVTEAGTGAVLYTADMSSDPGWALDAGVGTLSWQWGGPEGSDGDPAAGFSGSNVIGYNLAGAYPNDMLEAQYAATPAFDCSGLAGVTLSFRRWLGVESNEYDRATIEVSADGGPWVQVWANGSLTIKDTSWTLQVVDLATVADGRPSVRVRWGMGPTGSSDTYCGWNIDDVEVTGLASGPSVFAHTPAGDVPAGVDHVDVTFADPIDGATLNAGQVAVTDPSGQPVGLSGISHVAGSTYRVAFGAVSAPGTYTLRVGPGVTDPGGNEMDQDGDRTCGEDPDDVYVGTFAVVDPDTTGPAVVSHAPVGQVATPQDAVRVHFNEPMDTTSFGPDDIAVFVGPAGSLAGAVRGFQWLDPTTLEIRFDPQTDAGEYRMIVGPEIRDDAPGGNAMDQDADGTSGQPPGDLYAFGFTIRQVDLVPNAFGVDVDNLQAVQGAVSADFAVENDGPHDAGPFDIRFYLSDDAVIGPEDLPLDLAAGGGAYGATGLAAGGVLNDSVDLVAPAADPFGTDNDYYLGMIVDPDDQVPETHEDNNANRGLGVDVVRVHYSSDSDGPTVTGHTPDGATWTAVSAVTLIFNEPMDVASFSLAEDVAGFAGPDGRDLKGEVTDFAWLDNRTLEVRFATQRVPGEYELLAGPGILDVSGNPMDQDGDGLAGEDPQDRYAAGFRPENISAPTIQMIRPSISPACLADTSSMLALEAEVTDDGLGGPDGLICIWAVLDKPVGSTVTLEAPASANTVAAFSHEGTYSLALAATDGEKSSLQQVNVVIGDCAGADNVGPLTYAGEDQVAGNTSAALSGTVTDDGNPGTLGLICAWSQTRGPGQSTFADPSSPVTAVEAPMVGSYVYRLTADDGQIKTADDVKVMMALFGDANLDGMVGIADLVSVAEHYGSTSVGWRDGDFNADGVVGIADLAGLADNYGRDLNVSGGTGGARGASPVPVETDGLAPASQPFTRGGEGAGRRPPARAALLFDGDRLASRARPGAEPVCGRAPAGSARAVSSGRPSDGECGTELALDPLTDLLEGVSPLRLL